MIRHWFKLVWNRKKSNILIILEIVISFLALFAILMQCIQLYDRYNLPLGFEHENRWVLNMHPRSGDEETEGVHEQYRAILSTLHEFPEIIDFGSIDFGPYSNSSVLQMYDLPDKKVECSYNYLDDKAQEALGIKLSSGRWFQKDDDAANWYPVVINQSFVDKYIAPEEPIGANVADKSSSEEHRVVGVIPDFRKNGEFSENKSLIFHRVSYSKPKFRLMNSVVLKLGGQAPDEFEYRLVSRLESVAVDWSFFMSPMEQLRSRHFSQNLMPLLTVGLIAVFLLLMVGLGLLGVLWQNVTRRTREIGLRRAVGGSAGHIERQILGEKLVVASLGLFLGILIVIQFPLLNIFETADTATYSRAIVLSCLVIYLLSALSAWYPARLATRVQAREALHYE